MKPGSLAAKPWSEKGLRIPGSGSKGNEGNPGDPGSNPGRAISTGGRFNPLLFILLRVRSMTLL